MASVKWFSASIVVLFSIFSTVECVTNKGNCSAKTLLQCKKNFDENSTPLCGEVVELKECLLKQSDCEHSEDRMLRFTYRVLSFKLHIYASCINGEKGKKKCNESLARSCYDQFNGNATHICKEVRKLHQCLEVLPECHVMKHPSYTLSKSILDEHKRCFFFNYSKILEIFNKKSGKKKCNESLARSCYDQFNGNVTHICKEVKKLHQCLDVLQGCHVMRHPSYTLSKSILDEHKRCFFVNYSKSLKILNKKSAKKKCNESLARSCYDQFNGNASHICKEAKELHQCLEGLWECHVLKHPSYALSKIILDEHRRCFFVNYSKILEILDKKSEPTKTKHPINSTTDAKIAEIETSTNFLPVTFVVVATVCTCLFLIILVVFSVVRHTSLLRRQRHSTVERPPIRLQISPCRTSQRTRRSLRRNGRRNRHRHMYVIHEARQTVSGFFEGNVPPPPYSAVLDETESIRAGDLPPPYQPQPFVAIGVIV